VRFVHHTAPHYAVFYSSVSKFNLLGPNIFHTNAWTKDLVKMVAIISGI